ncbi:sensor histidine kinase [Streptomyces sp. 8L]|uniref:sensor histidine kinase n=1 Tax=Streptomyces sp. 8L TaxID=2877242 RepID=UPI001CD7C8EC|nr:ATP-binding protein [Streptomyces sp. 8L]MCA1217369.1 ATP-binding protein [Streptomyces sp. 8L]
MRALIVVPAAASGAVALSADYLLRHPSTPVDAGQALGVAVALSCITMAAGWVAVGRTVASAFRQRATDAAWHAQREEERRIAERIVQQMTTDLAEGIHTIEETLQRKGIAAETQHRFPVASGLVENLTVLQSQVGMFLARAQTVVDTAGRQERAALVTIGRRMISLLSTASAGFDALVRTNEDPALLEQAWRLDHTVVRVRRMAQSFALVGGARPQRSSRPVSLFEVVGHALGEVEHYRRVTHGALDLGIIRGEAAAGIAHLLAELIDNATNFSPPHTNVKVRGTLVPDGVLVEIEDRGVPMPEERRHALNLHLSDPAAHQASNPLQDGGQMGIWVVTEYANSLGLQVTLESTPHGGNQANVVIPHGLFEPRQDAGQRPVAVPLPTEAAHAVPPAAESAQRTHPQHTVGPRVRLPLNRGADSGDGPSSGPAPSGAHRSGGPVPDLPVRQSNRSYLASGLQHPAAPPTPPSKQEHDPTLLARFTRGRQDADTDRSTGYTTHTTEHSAPQLPGDTDGIRERQ